MTTHPYIPHPDPLSAFLKPEGERPTQIWMPIEFHGTTQMSSPDRVYQDDDGQWWYSFDTVTRGGHDRGPGTADHMLDCHYAIGVLLAITMEHFNLVRMSDYEPGNSHVKIRINSRSKHHHEGSTTVLIAPDEGTAYDMLDEQFPGACLRVPITSIEATTLGKMTYGDYRQAGCPVAEFNADSWRVDPDEIAQKEWWQVQHNEPWHPELWVWKIGVTNA